MCVGLSPACSCQCLVSIYHLLFSVLDVACLRLMLQFIMGQCDMNSVIGDKRMAELAVLGELLANLSLDELISYNGKFPLWKRIVVAFNTIQVCLFYRVFLW